MTNEEIYNLFCRSDADILYLLQGSIRKLRIIPRKSLGWFGCKTPIDCSKIYKHIFFSF